MDWDSLDLNEIGNGSSGIGTVDSKMANVVNNGKDCNDRNRGKNGNGGKF